MRVRIGLGALFVLLIAGPLQAQGPIYTDAFPAEEFSGRRARVLDQIGDAVVVMQGATEYAGYIKFRQNAQFFYLTGVEVPRAILLLDGRSGRSTLYLQPRNERAERSEGPVMAPGDEAVRLTAIDRVVDRDLFGADLEKLVGEGRVLYTPFRAEALHAATPGYSNSHSAASADDPWDGRLSREAAFIERIREVAPGVEIMDLDPVLDAMRLIKSPREIELIRTASRISGEAMIEGIRSAAVGMYEYELEAVGDYVFKRHNSQGYGYFSLIAAGDNASFPHYHASQSRLEDGDMVLWDWAPDYKYYTSDVTRMFPANGTFDADQREMYEIYLRLYQALMTSIKPYETPAAIRAVALAKMETIFDDYEFENPKIREAAIAFIDRYRGPGRSLGHMVGMEVHDVRAPYEVMQPGMVFTIEPALRIPEDKVYIRLEDAILITETGYENLSGLVPAEIEDIERLMAEEGWAERLWKRRQTTTSDDSSL
jgi:Xaa-Pro aminopeptidase